MIVENMGVAYRLHMPSRAIFYDDEIAPQDICFHIAYNLPLCNILPPNLCEKEIAIAELQSDDVLNKEQGKFVEEKLMEGHILLLIGAKAPTLPSKLLHAWERYAKHPHNTSAGAGRFIRFKTTERTEPLGTLAILLPQSYAGDQAGIEPHHCVSVGKDEFKLEIPEIQIPPPEIRRLG